MYSTGNREFLSVWLPVAVEPIDQTTWAFRDLLRVMTMFLLGFLHSHKKIILQKKQNLTYSQMGKVFKKSPAVVIDAVVFQDKKLAYVSGSNVTGNFYCSAGVIFIINFDYLQQKH